MVQGDRLSHIYDHRPALMVEDIELGQVGMDQLGSIIELRDIIYDPFINGSCFLLL